MELLLQIKRCVMQQGNVYGAQTLNKSFYVACRFFICVYASNFKNDFDDHIFKKN